MKCEYNQEGICVNDECPAYDRECPVPELRGVCSHEELVDEEFMLTPRELYNAMGFPVDYIIDRDWTGKEYKKTDQVARCGNAVCPPMAYAMVWANFPEWRTVRIDTMEQFHVAVAV